MDALGDQLENLSVQTRQMDERGPILHIDLVKAFSDSYPKHQDKPDVVFVCLDCEAFERDQKKVTEVGVAILDTRNLRDIDLFTSSVAIMEHIKAAHYRPVEYSKFVNKRFVHGCPDAFGFGTSTWVRLPDVAPILHRVFQDPPSLSDAARFQVQTPTTQRNVIVIGHGLGNDDKYLRTLGFSLGAVGNIVGRADTQKLTGSKTQVGLKKLLAALEIDAMNLHNAGNDAVYTLQAFVKMLCLKSKSPGRLAELLRAINGKPLERYDASVIAPISWGGTTVVGDERVTALSKPHRQKQGRGSRPSR
ncbi:hypothetical protein Q7P37_009954 [Cladosporium fusiforme]